MCRWSCASANQLRLYRPARSRIEFRMRAPELEAPLLCRCPGNRLLGARIAALGEMSVKRMFWGKVASLLGGYGTVARAAAGSAAGCEDLLK